MDTFIVCLQAFVVSAALSVDSLAAAAVLGASGIRIPHLSKIVISLIGSAALVLSVLIAGLGASFLPQKAVHFASFAMLSAVGLLKLSGVGSGAKGDRNRDKLLSTGEAALLSAALSVDSIGVGLGIVDGNFVLYGLSAFICTFLAVSAGTAIGPRGVGIQPRYFGLFFILMAVLRIV